MKDPCAQNAASFGAPNNPGMLTCQTQEPNDQRNPTFYNPGQLAAMAGVWGERNRHLGHRAPTSVLRTQVHSRTLKEEKTELHYR